MSIIDEIKAEYESKRMLNTQYNIELLKTLNSKYLLEVPTGEYDTQKSFREIEGSDFNIDFYVPCDRNGKAI